MNDSAWIWPASDMDFWKIDNKETSVKIKWATIVLRIIRLCHISSISVDTKLLKK